VIFSFLHIVLGIGQLASVTEESPSLEVKKDSLKMTGCTIDSCSLKKMNLH